MIQVWTTKGPLNREDLEVIDLLKETETTREKITEWYYKGELVRRDGWVSLLMPADIQATQGA